MLLPPFIAAAPAPLPTANYPDKPVRIIVPDAAHSRADWIARMVAPLIGAYFGERFLVDNRSGSHGQLGTELAARATADGCTLLIGMPATLTTVAFRGVKTTYDVAKDFAPIGVIAVSPFVLAAHPAVPVSDIDSLLTVARDRRSKLSYGVSNAGGTALAAMELLQSAARIDLNHESYPGRAQLIKQLLAGQVGLGMIDIFDAIEHVRARRLRPIAVTSTRRSTALPQVPTADESGLTGFEATKWVGLLAPARTPKEIVNELGIGLRRALSNPGVRWQLAQEGMLPGDGDGPAFRVRLEREIARYGQLKKPLSLRWP